MRFIVSSSSLLKNLQLISGVINPSSAMPILENFLFQLDQNKLTVTGTDLETTISSEIQVESNDTQSITVPSKILLETLKTFSDQPLTFALTGENTLEIVSEIGNYSLAYESADEFPTLPTLEDSGKISLHSDILFTAISKSIFATGNDDLRPVMTGIFFQFTPDVSRFVATDAHKLVKYSRKDITTDENIEFIMPKKALNLLKNTLGVQSQEVEISYNQNNAQFSYANLVLTCRLIDGKYPNYEAVIPKENPNVLKVNKNVFQNALRRVSIFSNKSTYQVKLKITGNALVLSTEDLDFSSKAEERLSCDYSGVDMQIGFNAKFLMEMVSHLNSEELTIEMSEPNRAGIVKPVDGLEEGEEILMLVMPVMLNR
ncbi:MAG: DNA polymerase III subunit beta [Flavobacteriaceae bacterium]|nr:MAG: DNA polymerase III subunit beta [Flavobacteriaceae bacterium]